MELRGWGSSQEFKSGNRDPAEGGRADMRVNGLGCTGFKRAFSGRMTFESSICLENPLVNLGKMENNDD